MAMLKLKTAAQRSEALWACLLVFPAVAGFAVFYLWPQIRTFYLSLTEKGAFSKETWVGLANYTALLNDPVFWATARNTLLYSSIVVAAGVPLALVIASMLNARGLRGKRILRFCYFLPVVTMPTAIAMVWQMLYAGEAGIINVMLRTFGIDGPFWLSDPRTALIAVCFVSVWSSLGINIVLLLAGLQSIPESYYEAAEIDGAGPIRRFFSITAPLLSPTVFFVMIMSVIGSLQVFDLVFLMVPERSPALPEVRTIVYFFYELAFRENNHGMAAALAFLLFLFIAAITWVQFRLQKKWVYYA